MNGANASLLVGGCGDTIRDLAAATSASMPPWRAAVRSMCPKDGSVTASMGTTFELASAPDSALALAGDGGTGVAGAASPSRAACNIVMSSDACCSAALSLCSPCPLGSARRWRCNCAYVSGVRPSASCAAGFAPARNNSCAAAMARPSFRSQAWWSGVMPSPSARSRSPIPTPP